MTPLLDWTSSPYVAAFFAFIEIYKQFEVRAIYQTRFKDGIVNVWGLRLWRRPGVEEDRVFEVVRLPRERGSRLWAQQGVFTRLNSSEHLDIRSYLNSRDLTYYLECYELRHESAVEALRDLDLMNINLASLFPDLQGAAEQANIESELLQLAISSEAFDQLFEKSILDPALPETTKKTPPA
jgi:hypothetical protein